MRTTLTLDHDVAAEIERLRRASGRGMSEIVNDLIRTGIAQPQKRTPYVHRSVDVGVRVDVANIGDVLDLLDEAG